MATRDVVFPAGRQALYERNRYSPDVYKRQCYGRRYQVDHGSNILTLNGLATPAVSRGFPGHGGGAMIPPPRGVRRAAVCHRM